MEIVKLNQISDGVIQAWEIFVEKNGQEGELIAYVNSDRVLKGWHFNISMTKSEAIAFEPKLREFIQNHEIKNPAVEFAMDMAIKNAPLAMCNVALENDNRELFMQHAPNIEMWNFGEEKGNE